MGISYDYNLLSFAIWNSQVNFIILLCENLDNQIYMVVSCVYNLFSLATWNPLEKSIILMFGKLDAYFSHSLHITICKKGHLRNLRYPLLFVY